MKKRLFAVLLAVLMIASLGTVAAFADDAETVYVAATTGDDTNGNGTQDSPYATLSKAASSVNDGDTINIAAGNYAGNVVIAHAVNIVGAGSNQTTITGNLKIAGYSTDDTSVTNKEITVSGIKMIAEEGSNNWGLYFGNGYANHPCWMNYWSLNVTDCAFEGWQYAICLQGGAFTSGDKSVTMSNNTLTVTNTTFADTFCATSVDAAIGELDMENSDFEAAGDNFFVCQQYGKIPGSEKNLNNYYSDLNDTTPIQVPISENGSFAGSNFEAVLLDEDGTPKKYAALSDLITAAEDGNTIVVTGEIDGNVVINKSVSNLTIRGEGGVIKNGTLSVASNGINLPGLTIEGLTFENANIVFSPNGASDLSDLTITGNSFSGATTAGLSAIHFNFGSLTDGSGADFGGLTITDNNIEDIVSGNNSGILIIGDGVTKSDITITGNTVDGVGWNGLQLNNIAGGEIIVTDNVFENCGATSPDGVLNLYNTNADTFAVNENVIIPNAGQMYVSNIADDVDLSNNYWGTATPNFEKYLGYVDGAEVQVVTEPYYKAITMRPEDLNTYIPPVNIPDTYDIDLIVSDGGEAKTNLSNASAGTTITVTVTPDEGYKLDYITVDGERISGTSFKMPEHDVTVRVYFTDGTSTLPFTDVRPNQWFYDAISYVYTNGMMEGDSATTFNPDGRMTRAMFWTVLGRIDGATITGANWIETARSWAMAEGVSDGTNPNDYVTREMMVTMLWRYAGEPASEESLSGYSDAASVSDWAAEAMSWALETGVIEGVTATTLQPQGTATRAQCATIFMRYDALVA